MCGPEDSSVVTGSQLKNISPELDNWLLEEEKEDELPYGCLICGDRPFFIGHIEKSDPNRMLVYCLCRECYEKPESDSIVEKIISYYETTGIDNPNLLDHSGEC